ncbi:hypothetical protein SAMN04488004_10657 [Loktanella salsilacus]|jgi:hypothetical protein|uniref:Transferrin-binding protein B C-lobe/N-lobe beta barrel domain-containing protein n=1 Tax=Loktanella salsilacus TaxID=195913 RepID=A0A1I4E7W4_9RHOB|nr:hypothetical protein [Loktanella salsilacus]SFL01353.1 hypothetical protein SAMN04488004_10657 [Loktanella salsilacus]
MTVNPLRTAISVTALAVMTACGGAGVPVTTLPQVPDNSRLSLAEIQSVQEQIAPAYDRTDPTLKQQVPVSGGSNYLGYVTGDLSVPGRRTDVAGVMQMGVDFSTDRVGGTAGNFVTSQGAPIDGVLTLSNGRLDRDLNRSQVTIRSDVDGTLRTGAGETVRVDGVITNGGFKGSSGQFIGAPMYGDITVSNGNAVEGGTFGLTGILARE